MDALKWHVHHFAQPVTQGSFFLSIMLGLQRIISGEIVITVRSFANWGAPPSNEWSQWSGTGDSLNTVSETRLIRSSMRPPVLSLYGDRSKAGGMLGLTDLHRCVLFFLEERAFASLVLGDDCAQKNLELDPDVGCDVAQYSIREIRRRVSHALPLAAPFSLSPPEERKEKKRGKEK